MCLPLIGVIILAVAHRVLFGQWFFVFWFFFLWPSVDLHGRDLGTDPRELVC